MSSAEAYATTDNPHISVLLVEDRAPEVQSIMRALENSDKRHDIRITTAGRLREANELLKTLHVDVILLDLSLPDAKGTRAVSATAEMHPNIPIIVLSGHSGGKVVYDALRKGAQEFLEKGEASGNTIRNAIYQAYFRKQLKHASMP